MPDTSGMENHGHPYPTLAANPARVIRILTDAGVKVAPGMDAYAIEYLTGEVSRLEGQSQ